MVRARTNRVVMSQRDVRQTTQPDHTHTQSSATTTTTTTTTTAAAASSSIAAVDPHSRHAQGQVGGSSSSKTYCTWCRANGQEYACLAEWSHASCCVESAGGDDCFCLPSQQQIWSSSAMGSEGWVPASGPCCEDCLEVAFDPRSRRKRGGGGDTGGKGEVVGAGFEEVDGWCRLRGERVRHTVRRGWQGLCGWLVRAKQRCRPLWAQDGSKVGGWEEVRYEAEGFLEVKVALSRSGVIQHMEVDLPTQVPLFHLKAELTTLIDVPPEEQQWFYQAQELDNTKTLEELNVNIGAIIEVKCRT